MRKDTELKYRLSRNYFSTILLPAELNQTEEKCRMTLQRLQRRRTVENTQGTKKSHNYKMSYFSKKLPHLVRLRRGAGFFRSFFKNNTQPHL